ncbi:Nop9 [Kluyveromyces lactis]|nr:Nop9 [Kluyveromyces lactis]
MARVRGRKLIKKLKKDEFHPEDDKNHDEPMISHVNETAGGEISDVSPNTFFGVLDSGELDYFKKAESTLAIDTFENPDEKYQFINSVIEESKGKELKLATSQISSKLMERIIMESDETQLKTIFKAFNGFYFNLACHKYSSHVVETLLVRGAAQVEKELLTPDFDSVDDGEFVTTESLFLFLTNELQPNLRFMVSHQYASHVLRILILVLSSKTLPSTVQNNSTLRSKKSKIARKMIDIKDNDNYNKVFKTPDSFKVVLRSMLSSIYTSFTHGIPQGSGHFSEISLADVMKFREICVDKIGSPVIQLIIQVEGIFDRDRSYWHLIFKDSDEKDPKEESFVEYLLSDAVGSHFLQNVIASTRIKYVERIYRLYMKDRIPKLAKRDTTAAFVLQSLLKVLNSKEVKEIMDELVPDLSVLLNSNMDFGTEIIDASIRHDNYLRDEIIEQLMKKYYPRESSDKNILESCLQLSSSTLGNTRDDWPTAEERRKSLFLEKLIDYDDCFLNSTIDSMLNLPAERLLQMPYHGVFSHVVEHVLQVKRVAIIKRKLLLNVLCKDIVNLSCNAYGSHIVDKLWTFTAKLAMYKERIATALCADSEKVKNSVYGRQVWKNWSLELFVRKRYDWKKIVKEQELDIFPDAKPLQPKTFKRPNNNNNSDVSPSFKKSKFQKR